MQMRSYRVTLKNHTVRGLHIIYSRQKLPGDDLLGLSYTPFEANLLREVWARRSMTDARGSRPP